MAGDRQATLHGVVFDILATRTAVAMRRPAGPELAAAPTFVQVSFGVAALLSLAGTNMTVTAAS